jgi:hypothetical protein
MTIICRSSIALLLAAFMLAPYGKQQQPPPDRPGTHFLAWICKKLKIDPSVYARVTRDIPPTRHGQQIVMFDLASHRESTIWSCPTGCWSPLVLDHNTVAVIQPDGIWRVHITQPSDAHKVLDSEGIRWLLGSVDQPSNALLVAISQDGVACSLQLRYADTSTGRLSLVNDSPETCVQDFGEFVRAGQIRDHILLQSSSNGTDVLITTLAADGSRGPEKLFDPLLDSSKDGRDRYDPQWIDDSRILYITREPAF